MKRIIYLGIILSVLMLIACGKASVEDVAKEYVKKQFASDKNVRVNTSKLKYTVTEKEGNKATVKVSGTINLDGKLFLIKHGKTWKISKKENIYTTQKKVASQTELKKAGAHTKQTISPKQTAHK